MTDPAPQDLLPDPRSPAAAPKDERGFEGLTRKLSERRARIRVGTVLRWLAAIVLTLVATALAAVPGVPGVPLFFLALILVAPEFPPARRLLAKLQRRLPKLRKMIPRRWRKKIDRAVREDGAARKERGP